MKNIIKHTLTILIISTIFFAGISCDEDFLNRVPQDAINDATFFKKTGDLKNYMTGRYTTLVRGNQRWNGLANGTDDLVTHSPAGSLMNRNSAGIAPETNGVWNNNYTNIRNINYFIDNVSRVQDNLPSTQHYIGEGYYARAIYYFNLLTNFGGVPIILDVLDTEADDLYKSRDSRKLVADQIMSDLDVAIEKLQ